MVKKISLNWKSYKRGLYVLFSVTRPIHTKICWIEETSYHYLYIVLDAFVLKYSNASMVKPCLFEWYIYIYIYIYSPLWNMSSGTHVALKSLNSVLLHTAWIRYYGSKLWNVLPHQVKNTRDIVTFKINITEWCQSKQCISLSIF